MIFTTNLVTCLDTVSKPISGSEANIRELVPQILKNYPHLHTRPTYSVTHILGFYYETCMQHSAQVGACQDPSDLAFTME